MMKFLIAALLFTSLCMGAEVSPKEAFNRLMQGNQRFVKGKLQNPDRDQERRTQTAAVQFPFATVLGCSDSRVPPEILFDQGIGDVFIVRVAGNVVGPIELASIEYSAHYLGSKILLVLGHENCGAVKAVLAGMTKDIEPIAELIAPAIEGLTLEKAVKANVKNVVKLIEADSSVAELIKQKKFAVVGGYYDLVSGKVEIITKSPN